MATTERPEPLSSGAGLGASVAVETGGVLGELAEIRARGYWEQAWLRFRRDKFAIGSGVFIVFLFFSAFAGPPLPAWRLGHGPNAPFGSYGPNPNTFIPVSPFSPIGDPRRGPPT